MAIKHQSSLDLSPLSSILRCFRRTTVVLHVMVLSGRILSAGEAVPPTLQSFGVQVRHGQPVYPLPANVALGLFNADPLLDVAYYADDKLQVFQNLGNGFFDLVGERSVSGGVAQMEWRKEKMFAGKIPNLFSWGELHITSASGLSEVIRHEQLVLQPVDLACAPRLLSNPPSLDFRESWRSESQTQPNTYMALDDVDNDGRTEIAYCFFAEIGDSNRFVVYECVGNDSFVVEWDTVLIGGFGPLAATDVDRNGHKEWVIINNGLKFLESIGGGRYKLYGSTVGWSSVGYITKGIQTDIDHDGIREVCVQQANPSPPPRGYATYIYVCEFVFKSGSTMAFSTQIALYYGYTFDMAVGQVDGLGRDEIIPAGGAFGVNEPVPIDYLWYDGSTWTTRSFGTGLRSGATAPMFVNLDADTTEELFIGGVGPIGHGSCFALDYVANTMWQVMWVDSSLRNTPYGVNAGFLAGEFVVAGANIWNPTFDTLYTRLHVYLPSGTKKGTWQRDSASYSLFYLSDIDNDGRTNLITALFFPWRHHVADYEYYGVSDVVDGSTGGLSGFHLFQNYPNPFNPSTTVRFHLAQRSHVELQVYDLLGRQVKTLVDDQMLRGAHELAWNGRTNQGGDAASGVYIVGMFVSKPDGSCYVETKKMLLLR